MDEWLLFWMEEYLLHCLDIVAVFGQIVHRSNEADISEKLWYAHHANTSLCKRSCAYLPKYLRTS